MQHAANKAVETQLTKENLLGTSVLTGHFGAVRGRNDFERCLAALILGRNQPPIEAVEAIARAIYATDPRPLNLIKPDPLRPTEKKYQRATRHIRVRNGTTVPVEVDVHPDPRAQRILETHRERESEQTIDRARLIFNQERKLIYIACNLPLDIVVDRVITHAELIGEITGQIDNGQEGKSRRTYGSRLAKAYHRNGGVLPLNRRELFRLHGGPDGLWTSERAVKDDLDPLMDALAEEGGIWVVYPN